MTKGEHKMKKLIAAALAVVMIVAQTSCSKKSDKDDNEYIYGQIESVSGNDVTLEIVNYNEKSDDSESDDTSDSDSSGSKRQRGNFKPGDFDGSMPDGFDPEKFAGKRPGSDDSDNSDNSGSKRQRGNFKPEDFDGSLPDGFDPEKFAGKRPGSDDSDNSDNSSSSKRSRPQGMPKQGGSKNSDYTLTGEKKEIRIPVGVSVTTSSGVKSSFDALKKGDIIKLSVEKDSSGSETVKEVWIMKK